MSNEEISLRHVLIISPYDMSSRNIIDTPVIKLLSESKHISVSFISRNLEDAEKLKKGGCNKVFWQSILLPFKHRSLIRKSFFRELRHYVADFCFTLGYFIHLSLVYRFNRKLGFRGFEDRLHQSFVVRWRCFKEGLPTINILGFPFSRSYFLFRFLYNLLYSKWQRHVEVETLFEERNPKLLILTHLQNGFVTPYILAANARNIPILGINGSWDQPTTKGPLCPSIRHILVQSKQTKSDLERYHDVLPNNISVVGWPQMDVYSYPEINTARSSFLNQIGLEVGSRYILFGVYARRLGEHETEICEYLVRQIEKGCYGSHVSLYIRIHPLDLKWEERFSHLREFSCVIIEPPDIGNLNHLAKLIKHAEVVLSSAGTIALDAVALDTPAVAIAFENEDIPYYERPARRYDMEHYKAVIEDGGIEIVQDYSQLNKVIFQAINNSMFGCEQRAVLREKHLVPLDGLSSARIVREIEAALNIKSLEKTT